MKAKLISFLLTFAAGPAWATDLMILAPDTKTQFESKYPTFFKEQWESCANCELRNLTPYNEKGEMDGGRLGSILEKFPNDQKLLFIAWNEVATPSNQVLIDALRKLSKKGVLILGPVGEPLGDGPSHALNRTVLGQVPGSMMIGELNEKESFSSRSFYGPEMLTAVKPSKELMGQKMGASIFAARLTKDWTKRSASDWSTHLKKVKSQSRRIWAGLDEFFR